MQLIYVKTMKLLIDDMSSYVILSMFFSHFQQVLAAKRRSIKAIVYDFETYQEHPKICEDFGKIKNEDSRSLKRLYRGRNSVPKSRGKLFRGKHLKRRKNGEFGPGTHTHPPRACHAPTTSKMRGAKAFFPSFLWVKHPFLAQSQVESLTINTNLPHSELKQFKRKTILGASEEFLSSPCFQLPCVTKSFQVRVLR